MKKLIVLLASAALAAALEAATAQFSYQGVLKNLDGTAVTGMKQVVIRLYDSADGTTVLWGRTYSVQPDSSGLFNVEVSDSTGTAVSGTTTCGSLEDVFVDRSSIYIGLTVDGTSGEIKPRQKMLPVPYAAFASNVAKASGNFTVSGLLTASSASFTGDLTASSAKVTQEVSAGSLTTSGNAAVSGDLTVSGTISGYGTVPVGGIIMWSGAVNEIPNGWKLCDGSTSGGITLPDLRNRFIVGAGNKYQVAATGGAETVTLTVAQIPSHTHSYQFTGADISGTWSGNNYFFNQSGKFPNNKNTRTTDATGGGQAHENRPPYYALCYIMRVK